MSSRKEDELATILRGTFLKRIKTPIENIISSVEKYSIFHIDIVTQTPGDFVFILKSMYNSLGLTDLKDENDIINYLIEGIDQQKRVIAQQAYKDFYNLKLTGEQYCINKKAKNIKQILGNLLVVATSMATSKKWPEDFDKSNKYILSADGELKKTNNNNPENIIEDGKLSSFMFLIEDYLTNKGYFKEPKDAEIIDAINVSELV